MFTGEIFSCGYIPRGVAFINISASFNSIIKIFFVKFFAFALMSFPYQLVRALIIDCAFLKVLLIITSSSTCSINVKAKDREAPPAPKITIFLP